MEKKVIKTIETHNLISRGETVVVGVSGGADSMALLNILMSLREKMGFDIAAAHINHGLRPEAYEEAEYVKGFCKKNEVSFYTDTFDVNDIARKYKLTVEQAGRRVRYEFFEKVMKECGAAKLATAHHKNDNAETVMLHLIRGSGIQGLCGIRYRRGNIIRPLLDVTRTEIEEYCRENNILYCTDKTNLSTEYTRNRLRLITIPHIEQEYNTNFTDVLSRLSVVASETEDFMNSYSREVYNNNVKDNKINIKFAKQLPNAVLRHVIRYMIENAFGKAEDISFAYTESIINMIKKGHTGKSIAIAENIIAFTQYDMLVIGKKSERKHYKYRLSLNNRVYIEEAGLYITMTEAQNGFEINDLSNVFATDRQPGDVFFPEGMIGKKKLKDFFIDIKLPVSERDKIPIIRYNDDILSVGNIRRDRRYLGKKGVLFKIEHVSKEVSD